MLIATLSDTFTRRYDDRDGYQYSKMIRNQFKKIYEDLVKLVIHDCELEQTLGEHGNFIYICPNKAFAFNSRKKNFDECPTLHGNPVDNKSPNSLMVKFISQTDENLQMHINSSELLPEQECLFFTSNIPLCLRDKNDRSTVPYFKYINMTFGIIPFGTKVYTWKIAEPEEDNKLLKIQEATLQGLMDVVHTV